MNTDQEGTPTMFDRSQVDAAIFRVAVAAFTYYPERATREPGYTIDEDLDWCLRPLLTGLTRDNTPLMREQIRELITNPGADRQAFIRMLHSMTNE